MKNIFQIIIGLGLILLLVGCSTEDPQFRVYNERTDKANVQIQTSGGNTININDVGAGQTTAYQSAAEGTIVVTAVIQNVSVSPTARFFCGKDTKYTIVIQAGINPTIRMD